MRKKKKPNGFAARETDANKERREMNNKDQHSLDMNILHLQSPQNHWDQIPSPGDKFLIYIKVKLELLVSAIITGLLMATKGFSLKTIAMMIKSAQVNTL